MIVKESQHYPDWSFIQNEEWQNNEVTNKPHVACGDAFFFQASIFLRLN